MEVCPEKAITETERELGIIEKGHRNGLEFVHGKLRVGEAMSPPLIKKVREYTRPDILTIVDAPPGTSCPDCFHDGRGFCFVGYRTDTVWPA